MTDETIEETRARIVKNILTAIDRGPPRAKVEATINPDDPTVIDFHMELPHSLSIKNELFTMTPARRVRISMLWREQQIDWYQIYDVDKDGNRFNCEIYDG